MEHPVYRVVDFEVVGQYRLKIIFDDGHVQIINFKPILVGDIYGPLLDDHLFNMVEIDPEIHTLVWPNSADFDPATLHDWPKYLDSMKALAEIWSTRKIKVE